MSMKNDLKAESKAESDKHDESALQRVVSLEKHKFIPQLNHLLILAAQKEQILAAQILAKKELQCPARGDQLILEDAERIQLNQEIDDRRNALLNHRMVKNTLQTAAFNIQMQEAVRDGLQQVDVNDTMEHFQERGVLLAHCGNNRESCKELVSLVEQSADMDKEIFQLHMQYSSSLKEIKHKWEALRDRVMHVQEESEPLIQLRERVRERENKIQLLVTMIQGLISTCGFQWAAYEYYLQVMLLCDSVMMHQDAKKQDAIMKEISRIRESDDENKGKPREMLSASKSKKKSVT